MEVVVNTEAAVASSRLFEEKRFPKIMKLCVVLASAFFASAWDFKQGQQKGTISFLTAVKNARLKI